MNRQTIVGLFTVLGLLALFAFAAVLANIGTGGRYKTGVHFKSASGIHKGALVYESGVNVGIVDSLQLLPEDFTVDVIMAINNSVDIPRNAKFIIQAPLTGDATLEIVPHPPTPREPGSAIPTPAPAAIAILPHEVLPLAQQPLGTNPATLADLLDQGQGEVKRLDTLLADLEKREPALLNTFTSALNNANELTVTSNQEIRRLAARIDSITAQLSSVLDQGSTNVLSITRQVDALIRLDGAKTDTLLTSLNTTAHSLNQTATSVQELASNPQIRSNLLETTKGIAQTATTIASISGDLHNVTGNPQTQAQLRDTLANVDAASQKANSLLKALGGTSSVYGVDPGATPAPTNGAVMPAVPQPVGTGSGPAGKPGTPGNIGANLKSKIGSIARDVLSIEIRVSELNAQKKNVVSSPLLTKDRGPQTDFNIHALPNGNTSVLTGANDIGSAGTTTYNFAALGTVAPRVHIGGGILYSRLGVLGSVDTKAGFGVEGRLYDLRRPTFDGYANARIAHGVELFAGERDALRPARRTVFGLQLKF